MVMYYNKEKLAQKWATLGVAVVAVAVLLARTVKGIVSFVPNLLPTQTPKEGVRGVQASAFFQPAAAVAVGIGLLASPFLVQSDDEKKTNKAPEVGCIWVENHGSIGFDVEFDVSAPSDVDLEDTIHTFRLNLDGYVDLIDREWAPSATLESEAPNQGWLEIPGYDGGPPLPYPGYSHSFDYAIYGEQQAFVPLAPSSFRPVLVAISQVSISLYVILNSNGSLHSMHAWASDSDGDGYEVPVYYSPGGSENFRTFED